MQQLIKEAYLKIPQQLIQRLICTGNCNCYNGPKGLSVLGNATIDPKASEKNATIDPMASEKTATIDPKAYLYREL